MGPAVVEYRFKRLPSAFRYFPRAVFGRRSALVPAGQLVPRLEAHVGSVTASPSHLARYREICGFADDGCLPITYPHVVAMPLQYAILTHPRFPSPITRCCASLVAGAMVKCGWREMLWERCAP